MSNSQPSPAASTQVEATSLASLRGNVAPTAIDTNPTNLNSFNPNALRQFNSLLAAKAQEAAGGAPSNNLHKNSNAFHQGIGQAQGGFAASSPSQQQQQQQQLLQNLISQQLIYQNLLSANMNGTTPTSNSGTPSSSQTASQPTLSRQSSSSPATSPNSQIDLAQLIASGSPVNVGGNNNANNNQLQGMLSNLVLNNMQYANGSQQQFPQVHPMPANLMSQFANGSPGGANLSPLFGLNQATGMSPLSAVGGEKRPHSDMQQFQHGSPLANPYHPAGVKVQKFETLNGGSPASPRSATTLATMARVPQMKTDSDGGGGGYDKVISQCPPAHLREKGKVYIVRGHLKKWDGRRFARCCGVEGCTKLAQGPTNYCKGHGGGTRCKAENCKKAARGGSDSCAVHGGGKRCKVEGCSKAAVGNDFCRRHGGGKRLRPSSSSEKPEHQHAGMGFNLRQCARPDCHQPARADNMACAKHAGVRTASASSFQSNATCVVGPGQKCVDPACGAHNGHDARGRSCSETSFQSSSSSTTFTSEASPDAIKRKQVVASSAPTSSMDCQQDAISSLLSIGQVQVEVKAKEPQASSLPTPPKLLAVPLQTSMATKQADKKPLVTGGVLSPTSLNPAGAASATAPMSIQLSTKVKTPGEDKAADSPAGVPATSTLAVAGDAPRPVSMAVQ